MLYAGLLLNKRYRILNSLRSGGFAHTYVAEDQAMPTRPRCVVKQFTYRHDDETVYQQVAERFFREAAVIESLGKQSDQIPSLFAYFEEDEQLYLVQEWIDGDPFDTFVRPERRLNESRVQDLLVSLLPVLDLIHSKGFIHRDIKPSNIILRRADNQPVLIDFGVVKELLKGTVARGTEENSRTIIVGSPGFTAPEQIAGYPVFASDFFSLGMTAISLLTGKNPARPVSGTFRWREHVPDITPHLATILEKSIAPDRTQRFQTAQAMLKALLDPPAQSPPPAPPSAKPTAPPRAPVAASIPTIADTVVAAAAQGKTTKRKGLLVTAGLVVALAVIWFVLAEACSIIKIYTGTEGGTFDKFGEALAHALKEELGGLIRVQAIQTDGSKENCTTIREHRKSTRTEPMAVLGQIAVGSLAHDPCLGEIALVAPLYTGVLYLAVRDYDAMVEARQQSEVCRILGGAKSIYVGNPGSGTLILADSIRNTCQIPDITRVDDLTFEEAAARLINGELGAAFFWLPSTSELLHELDRPGICFVPVPLQALGDSYRYAPEFLAGSYRKYLEEEDAAEEPERRVCGKPQKTVYESVFSLAFLVTTKDARDWIVRTTIGTIDQSSSTRLDWKQYQLFDREKARSQMRKVNDWGKIAIHRIAAEYYGLQ